MHLDDRTEALWTRIVDRGLVDTHFHIGPEFVPRKYDVLTLAEAARSVNATMVLKCHTWPTTPLAALARLEFKVDFLGSVVLNRGVGGLNHHAVRAAVTGNHTSLDAASSTDPPMVVWMPTVHASAHMAFHGGGTFDARWLGCGGGEFESLSHEEVEPIEAFDTPLEDGWGLTVDPHDENRWIVTDASEHMRFVERTRGAAEDDAEGEDSDSRVASSRLALAESVPVRDGDRSIRFTNELETIGEEVWANVIETECIARVDPRSGAVVGWVDMTGLRDALDPGAPTKAGGLNGIAADGKSGRIFVTGKNWPNLFEVTVHETDADLEEVRKTCWPPMSLPQYGYP